MKSPAKSATLDIVRQWGTLAAILGTFAVNAWSNLFPINNLNIGEIANTLFRGVQIIPANYAFSIWGVIYLGLLAYGVYQLLPNQRQNPTLRRVDYLLIISCVVQAFWVVAFLLRQFWASTLMMVGILLPLIGIYLQLGIGRRRISRQEKWFAHVPFSIYLGWISVATIVNVAVSLYNNNWDGWGLPPQSWTVIMMVIASVLAALVALKRRDIAYPLVIVWALIGIAVRQATLPMIATVAIVLAIALIVLVVFVQFKLRSAARNT
ncbi:tryptophan-rich sensory protein [Thermocoleostomius sinensis]|uniref:Tryptophan-rich sensory protein n=1 Tax=Thermocoleostomius sinensis A174 TaxID=2016057 RepID=A0A9E9C8X1_9CYAN|nr:tryptophan-rich sensory protein [Thermocoleostomius sinensis]WAL61879.1 tryptophan-rich sensory protein [Thermocoleostomius sinensis A174]